MAPCPGLRHTLLCHLLPAARAAVSPRASFVPPAGMRFPLVVKPTKGSQGTGVFMNLQDIEQTVQARFRSQPCGDCVASPYGRVATAGTRQCGAAIHVLCVLHPRESVCGCSHCAVWADPSCVLGRPMAPSMRPWTAQTPKRHLERMPCDRPFGLQAIHKVVRPIEFTSNGAEPQHVVVQEQVSGLRAHVNPLVCTY